MSKRYVTISDLTGQPINDDNDVVTIAVLEHPTLEHPVQLDAAQDELKGLSGSSKDFVLLEVLSDGGDKRERMVLELADFERLIKSGEPQDVLENAERYETERSAGRAIVEAMTPKRRGRGRGAGGGPKAEKVDYKTLEHAGTPHRGRTTEEEANIVRNNLDTVNRRRREQGYPPIDPQDPKDAARYGFDQVPSSERPVLSPEFKS
jgi:hypothetical protein